MHIVISENLGSFPVTSFHNNVRVLFCVFVAGKENLKSGSRCIILDTMKNYTCRAIVVKRDVVCGKQLGYKLLRYGVVRNTLRGNVIRRNMRVKANSVINFRRSCLIGSSSLGSQDRNSCRNGDIGITLDLDIGRVVPDLTRADWSSVSSSLSKGLGKSKALYKCWRAALVVLSTDLGSLRLDGQIAHVRHNRSGVFGRKGQTL